MTPLPTGTPLKEGNVLRVILLKKDALALIGATAFYLITQKLNKRYSGEQEIASEKTTPIYNSRNNCSKQKTVDATKHQPYIL